MTQHLGDPSNIIQTISTQGHHIPISLAYSQDCSLFSVGCEDGILFIYDVPLLSFKCVYQLDIKEPITSLLFSPCNKFIFVFQLFNLNEDDFKFQITQVEIGSKIQFVNQVPIVQPSQKVFSHYIDNIFIFKILPSQFRYFENQLTGFEFLLHTYDDIIMMSYNNNEKIQIYSLFSQTAPYIPLQATQNVQDISLIYSKYLIVHLSNLILIFTRNYNIPSLSFMLTSLFSIDFQKFDLQQVLNIDQTLPILQSFVVIDLIHSQANFYQSYEKLINKQFIQFELPQNFLIIHDEHLHFYILSTIEIDEIMIKSRSQQLNFCIYDLNRSIICPKPYPSYTIAGSNSDDPQFEFFYSNYTLDFYHFLQLNSPIVNPLMISQFKDRYVIISRKTITSIPVSETEKHYEVHVLQTSISAVGIGQNEVGFHSSMACCGEFQPKLVDARVSVRRKLKFSESQFTTHRYQAKQRHNVVLLGLPIRYTQFSAFFNGFQTVGQHVLYMEREDEFDLEEDLVLYPKQSSNERSIERIQRQVQNLKGYTINLIPDGEDIDLGL